MKLARVSPRGSILSFSIAEVTSTFAPSLGIVQDKMVSRIVRPHGSMHVSIAIRALGHFVPSITVLEAGPLMREKIA